MSKLRKFRNWPSQNCVKLNTQTHIKIRTQLSNISPTLNKNQEKGPVVRTTFIHTDLSFFFKKKELKVFYVRVFRNLLGVTLGPLTLRVVPLHYVFV